MNEGKVKFGSKTTSFDPEEEGHTTVQDILDDSGLMSYLGAGRNLTVYVNGTASNGDATIKAGDTVVLEPNFTFTSFIVLFLVLCG